MIFSKYEPWIKTPLNSITVISSIMARNKDNLLNESQIKIWIL